MNIIQVQDDLKNFSQDQLVKEMQRPSGMAPQFLVLSEINRRQRVKQDLNARQSQQQPTVAEEAIASAGIPQGGLASMSQALAPKSASELSTGVGTNMPMAMQSGGFLKTPDEIDDELDMMSNPDDMDFSNMSLEEIAAFAKKMKDLGPTKMASGGLAQFGNEIRQSMGQEIEPYLDQVENEAESKFNIDLDQNQTDNIMQLPGPRIPTISPIRPQIRPAIEQVGIGGKGIARPAILRQRPLRGGSEMFANIPFGGQSRGYAEGGLVSMQEGGQTLGIRQNNPGNIRPGGGFFGETGIGSGYATFQSPLYGGRALARLLSTYKNEYGINNVDSLIDRYAPSGDNTSKSRSNYKGFIADRLGVSKDDEIDLNDDNTKLAVMKSIVEFENKNDNPYSDQEYNLMIQSAKMDDETKISELLDNTNSAKVAQNNLPPISDDVMGSLIESQKPNNQSFGSIFTGTALAANNKDNNKVGEFGPAGLDRPDMFLPRFLAGKRSLQPGEIGFEAAYGAGLRPFDESDEVSGSKIPRLPGKKGEATYEDLLNLEQASRAESGFIDPIKAFGGPAVDTGEGGIVKKDDKDFVQTKVTEKDASGKEKVVTKELELDEDGTVKKDGKVTQTTPTVFSPVAPTNPMFQRSSLEQDIIDLQGQLKKDREVDKWLGIAKAGLALADPTKTLSEAAESGIDAMTAANKRYTDGVVDLINARAKLAKTGTGLKLSELFTNLSRNRTSQTKYSEMGSEPNPELLQRLQDEERELLNLISRYPGFDQFQTGISVAGIREKLAENQKAD